MHAVYNLFMSSLVLLYRAGSNVPSVDDRVTGDGGAHEAMQDEGTTPDDKSVLSGASVAGTNKEASVADTNAYRK